MQKMQTQTVQDLNIGKALPASVICRHRRIGQGVPQNIVYCPQATGAVRGLRLAAARHSLLLAADHCGWLQTTTADSCRPLLLAASYCCWPLATHCCWPQNTACVRRPLLSVAVAGHSIMLAAGHCGRPMASHF